MPEVDLGINIDPSIDTGSTEPAIDPSTTQGEASRAASRSYIGDSGLLTIFQPEHELVAASDETVGAPLPSLTFDLPPPELQQGFAETYIEYCWPWCPVLDRSELYSSLGISISPLLANAVALLGSCIRPPLAQHAQAADYYNRAKMLFYTDQEKDPLTCLQAISLFYWWAPRAPSTIHKDAAWWWTGLAIKYAQQMGLHREPTSSQHEIDMKTQCLRRRIWWTLFVSLNAEYCAMSSPDPDRLESV